MKKPLRLTTQLVYGLGDLPVTLTTALFGFVILFFYNSVMRLPGGLTGVGISIGLVIDAVLDPYIGYRSDRFKHRLGRRHPFMFFGAALIGVFFFLLLSPPHLSKPWLFVWLIVSSSCFRTVSAIYRIPYLTLAAEITQDYDERTRIIGWRSLFGLVGLLAGTSLTFLLFFRPTPGGLDPRLEYSNYPRIGLVWGVLMSATALASSFGTLGTRDAGKPANEAVRDDSNSFRDFFGGFWLALRNPSSRGLWFSTMLFLFAVALNAAVAVQYFVWYAGLKAPGIMGTAQACFGVGAAAGVAFWVWYAKRQEKKFLYIFGLAGTGTLLAAATFLIGQGNLLGTGNAAPLIAGHAVAGFMASVVWVLPPSMLADTTDQDELETKQKRGGIYFGIFNFGEKIAAGAALLAAGLLIQFFVHLTPGAATQTESAVSRLGQVYGLAPALVLVLAAVAVVRYDLTRERVQEIQHQLADRRAIAPDSTLG